MDSCEACRRLVSALAQGSCDTTTVERADETELGLRPGARVGRLSILERLGQGGMGTVYSAYDAKLDRKVALKFLRYSRHHASERLLKEAQSLAQLSHPNVVQVHDFGDVEGRSYISMEYCEGQTLGTWCHENEASWETITSMLSLAGAGVAAAHRAGLVHRDFKPSNVMVTKTGQVKVMDLGLARREQQNIAGDTELGDNTPLTQLTQTGTLLGTPRYMAPEQLRGDVADARSDQYSFCVSLYELLYGTNPFEGKTVAERLRSQESGPSRPSESKVPSRIHDAMLRGLSRAPSARYGGMDELLAALSPEESSTRHRWLAFGGAAMVALGTTAFFLGRGEPDKRCARAAARATDVWHQGQRDAVLRALGGDELASHVVGLLDERNLELAAGLIDTCEATYVRQEQSEELGDKRRLCLERHVLQFESLVEVFSGQTTDEVREGAGSLEFAELLQCSNVERLSIMTVLPSSREALECIEVAQRAEAKADALHLAGLYEKAEVANVESVRLARQCDYPPVLAVALYTQLGLEANTQPDAAVSTARELIQVAAASHDDSLLAVAWPEYILALGDSGRSEEAIALAPAAEAALKRVQADATDISYFYLRLAGVFQAEEPEKALVHYEKAISGLRESGAENANVNIAAVKNNIGNTLTVVERYREAAEIYEEALPVLIEEYGEKHTSVLLAQMNLAAALVPVGKLEEATMLLKEIRTPLSEAVGTDSRYWAMFLHAEGELFLHQEDWERALVAAHEAAKVRAGIFGEGHTEVLASRELEASALAGAGKLDAAAAVYRETIAERATAGDALEVVNLTVTAGEMLVQAPFANSGRFANELGLWLERAEQALRASNLPAGYPRVMKANNLAAVAIDAKRFDLARSLLAYATENEFLADPQERRDTQTLLNKMSSK